jgi:predicted TIM-barrel fold metal-dependent hydrolase
VGDNAYGFDLGLIPWSPEHSIEYMDTVGTSTTMLSFSLISLVKDPKASIAIAREFNEYAAAVRDARPSRFGVLATLPSLLEPAAALEEISFAYEELHVDGVQLLTRYGDNYLGHPSFVPIWNELNSRKAVVFVHPYDAATTTLINKPLPPPILDFPQETTRTTLVMIVNGTMRSFPQCKVILSHAGGHLPYVIGRAQSLVPHLVSQYGMPSDSMNHMIEDAQAFYFDLALSRTSHTLDTLLRNFPVDHIMCGSDFPMRPPPATIGLSKALDEYEMDSETREKIYWENAITLFPQLKSSGHI